MKVTLKKENMYFLIHFMGKGRVNPIFSLFWGKNF